jgi:hypothetical protein
MIRYDSNRGEYLVPIGEKAIEQRVVCVVL